MSGKNQRKVGNFGVDNKWQPWVIDNLFNFITVKSFYVSNITGGSVRQV